MSYFDHVKCPNCRAEFDPARVEQVGGQMSCPSCQSALGVADLFGIKAAFMEGDQPNLSLDDLVPGANGYAHDPWAQPEGGHPMNHGRWQPNVGAMPPIHGAAPPSEAPRAYNDRAEPPHQTRSLVDRQGQPPQRGGARMITDRSGAVAPPVRSVGVSRPASRQPRPAKPSAGSALDILKKMKKR